MFIPAIQKNELFKNFKFKNNSFMKNFIIIIMAALFCLPAFAQKDLSQMNQKERNAYLVKLAKEVTKTMGPGWYRGKILTDISGPDINKRVNNRKYYTVKFSYDEKTSKETGGWKYASETQIWENNGEPWCVMFGLGYGIIFNQTSYQTMKKTGEYKKSQIPFEKFELEPEGELIF